MGMFFKKEIKKVTSHPIFNIKKQMAGIYIHIPFCKQRCSYCAFYSTTLYNIREQYVNALCKELVMRKDYAGGATIETIYFGGGTPSTLSIEQLQRICNTIYATYPVSDTAEVTIECNPDDLTTDFLSQLKELPFNRISMGVQSFNDTQLKRLGRRHNADKARQAVKNAREAGYDNISIDLIFGLPQLTDELWDDTLEKALAISSRGNLPKHISAYQLSVEEGSMLEKMISKGMCAEAPEEECRRQYEKLCRVLQQAGYEHYEISNFAMPGYQAKHNSAYWKHVPYVGLGPGAHSFLDGKRLWNADDLSAYLKAGSNGDFSEIRGSETLDQEQKKIEKIMDYL